jgi:hypothetical protein
VRTDDRSVGIRRSLVLKLLCNGEIGKTGLAPLRIRPAKYRTSPHPSHVAFAKAERLSAETRKTVEMRMNTYVRTRNTNPPNHAEDDIRKSRGYRRPY